MGLTFLNGIFAFALGAVAMPIVIHLLNRRRSRREPFSSLEFLDEVTRRQRKRVQLRQWLLLALRTVIIALLALAMMRPALRAAGAGGSGSTTAVVIFDTSFSMAAADEEASNVERARARVAGMADLFGDDDRVQVVWPSRPPRTAFDAPVRDFGRALAAIDQAPLSYTAAAHREAIEAALSAAGAATSLNREIYVVSDFQVADWPAGGEEPALELPEDVRIYLVPIGVGDLPNVGIASASFVQASVQSGSAGAVRVTLGNHTESPLAAYPVRVFDGEDVVAEGPLRVPPMDLATTDLPLARRLPEPRPLEVRIDEDALAIDDRAYVTPGDRQTLRVLIVHGGGVDTARQEPFLSLALDPPGEVGARHFDVDEVALRDLPVTTDLDHDVFVLNNVERLSEGGIQRLRLAHRDGAGILIILGDRVDIRYYNEHVLETFIDAELDQPVSSDGSFFTLRPEVPGHPIFEGFKVGAMEDVTNARFLKLVRANVGAGARVLATLGSHPALVEGERVLLLTTSVDLRWGSFPTGGSFLPILHQSILTLASRALEARQFRAGSPIVLDVGLEEVEGEVRCFAPDGAELGVETTVRAGRVDVLTRAAPVPGVYRFTATGRTLREVAVHLDPAEGRLRFVDPEAVATGLGEGVRILGPGEAIAARVLEDRRGREIWRELLLAAFLLALVETVVGRVRLA